MSPNNPLIGASVAFREAMAIVERAAASELAVLIQGESGTGKEEAARRLHTLSARNKGPFVAVNLAALPDSLVEDELFGHEAGAFTGAVGARKGRFRKANGGTLFLDEVGDIPLQVQVKLLRALEEKLVEPLGSEVPEPIDVRVVAATHRELQALVDAGKFRRDLFHRLAVVVARLPALREREGDVGLLARHFAAKPAGRLPVCDLDPTGIAALEAHAWPGNVRELENAILRARALAGGQTLDAAAFGFLSEPKPDVVREVARLALRHGVKAPELEKALIEEAVQLCRGNEAEASRRLGITRRAVEYRRSRR